MMPLNLDALPNRKFDAAIIFTAVGRVVAEYRARAAAASDADAGTRNAARRQRLTYGKRALARQPCRARRDFLRVRVTCQANTHGRTVPSDARKIIKRRSGGRL